MSEAQQELSAQSWEAGTEVGKIENGSLTVAATHTMESCKFSLKVMEGAQASIFFLDVIERASEEVVDFGFGALRLGNFFNHRTEVGSNEGIGVVQSKLWPIG